mgnify:FL=1
MSGMGFLLKVSRFRFWIYTAGTYVVGYALGASSLEDFFRLEYFAFLLYFFVPANVFIYGVNDYYDRDTDALNPKKDGMEHRVAESERRTLVRGLQAVLLISAALLIFLDPTAALLFLCFLGLSYFYSAPPLRFKARPFLDFSSNMLYIMPGILAYYLASGSLPSVWLVAAGFLHIAAMHLFSAVPDIECDRQAGITTSAVLLGKRVSLLLCLLFWSGLAALALMLTGFHYLSFLVLLYPAVPLSLLAFSSWRVERVYWYLPYLNTILGGMLFTVLVLLLAVG